MPDRVPERAPPSGEPRPSLAAPTLAALLILAGLMPPTGVLTPNEEQYFQLAHAWFRPDATPEPRPAFDGSRHRLLSELLIGASVSAFGFEDAQVFLRVVLLLAFALTFGALATALGIGWRGAALALVGFHAFHQHLLGHEWLFYSAEAKSMAYPLVFAALAAALGPAPRPLAAAALLAAATYLHVQVGGFWALALLALLALPATSAPRPLRALAAYALLVAPMLALVAVDRITLGSDACDASATRATYAVARNAHHVAPFASRESFRDEWALRITVLLLLTLGAARLRPRLPPRLRPAAALATGCLLYLLAALAASALDRHALRLAALYLFRPSSLALLLLLLVAAGALEASGRTSGRGATLLILLLALGAAGRGLRHVGREVREERALRSTHDALVQSVSREVPVGAALLVDPLAEGRHLALHRRLLRGTAVCWKIVPTNDRDLCEWQARLTWRERLFADPRSGAAAPPGIGARPVVLLTDVPERAADWAAMGLSIQTPAEGWSSVTR